MCVRARTCLRARVHAHERVYVCIRVFIRAHFCAYVCAPLCTCVRVWVCVRTCVCAFVYGTATAVPSILTCKSLMYVRGPGISAPVLALAAAEQLKYHWRVISAWVQLELASIRVRLQ